METNCNIGDINTKFLILSYCNIAFMIILKTKD